MIATSLRHLQSEMLNVLTDIRHNSISPLLISPQQLKQQFEKMRDHLMPGQMLPVSIDDVAQVYKMIKAEGTILDKQIIFKLTLPLISSKSFEFYNLVPIPTVNNGSSITMIKVSIPIVAINSHRDEFIDLTLDDISKCHEITNEDYICYNKQSIHSLENHCEFQLFNNKTSSSCESGTTNKTFVWIKMHQRNKWIFSSTATMELSAVCRSGPSNVQLVRSGLISIHPSCTLRNPRISVSGYGKISSKIASSYARYSDITSPSVITKITKPPMIVNLTELHQLKEKFLHDNKFKLPFNIEPITHHHIASYVALFISIFIIILVAYKKFKECRTRQPSNQPKDVNDVPFSINIRDC